MAELIRGFDWTKTSLGPIDSWPDNLVITVNLLLASRHPMFLWWGPELIQFYNDGYRPSIRADKHPVAVGQRGTECWPEIWPIIGPQIEAVMTEGLATWHQNQLVPINRDGKLEEVYWTYGYSPIRNNRGEVDGTLVVCTETTDQVLNERRLNTLLSINTRDRSSRQVLPSQVLRTFAREIIATLEDDCTDVPFAVLYQVNETGCLRLGATSVAPAAVDTLCDELVRDIRSQIPVLVPDLQRYVGRVICRPWSEAVTRAYVLPLVLDHSAVRAALILGISPRLQFDESYQTFFQLVGARIAGLLQGELQRLELAQAAVRFQALAEADPFGMVFGTLSGKLRYVNPIFLKKLGFSEEDVRLGKVRWDLLTPPEFATADARAVEQLSATGRCEVYEKVFLAKDGRRIPILLGASIIDDPDGEPEVAAFVTDLTPLKAAEAALRTANEELEIKVADRTAALEAEIAERQRMELSLRELTGRLLQLQDHERRHMARELHDNAGQTLAALSMKLSAIQTESKTTGGRLESLATEAREFSDELSKEIRTLSYLLHPPLLDEIGLQSAIRWFVEGFSERSKIKVELDLPESDSEERLPRELELVLFRIVQESLTNVHRHSGSASAKIQFTRSATHAGVAVTDYGKGIAADRQRQLTSAKAGVGVRGMRERVRQFGGSLEITSTPAGTTVTALLPITPDSGAQT